MRSDARRQPPLSACCAIVKLRPNILSGGNPVVHRGAVAEMHEGLFVLRTGASGIEPRTFLTIISFPDSRRFQGFEGNAHDERRLASTPSEGGFLETGVRR